MQQRKWAAVAAIVMIVVVGIAAVIISQAPAISNVATVACISTADSCLRFPTISGSSLSGQAFSLPQDFVGDQVLVIVPFDEDQQTRAETWLPFARDIKALEERFGYYDVPVFPDMATPLRTIIRAGLALVINDEQLRDVTIPVFLDDVEPFLSALEISDRNAIQVFLLNSSGEVVWRGVGEFTAEQGDSLRTVIENRGDT